MDIHKFGGGIWGTQGEGLLDIDKILDYEEKKVAVVSAFDGTTNKLRSGDWESVLKIYAEAGRRYIKETREADEYRVSINEYESRLRKGKKYISRAEMWGLGELLSTDLLYHRRRSRGKSVRKLSFDETFPVIARKYRLEDADPDLEACKSRSKIVRDALSESDELIAPGFLAYTKDEQAVTLGEGGSDTTAYVLAHMLSASNVTLWKETEGIRTANPDIIPDAKLVEYLTLSEGLNLALFGGKILNYKAIKIGYDKKISGKVQDIKPPHKATNIVQKKDEPKEWARRLAKYVGGISDALQIQVPNQLFTDFTQKIIENNLGDFTHIIGPLLFPQLLILDRTKVSQMELTPDERKIVEKGKTVAVVNVVGDGLGPAKNVLTRGSKAISKHTSILGNITSTRNGETTEGAYMSFAVEPSVFKETIRWLHREFIENDPTWKQPKN